MNIESIIFPQIYQRNKTHTRTKDWGGFVGGQRWIDGTKQAETLTQLHSHEDEPISWKFEEYLVSN